MIKIELKPISNEIEIPDYGVFTVSPLGAGAEADIRIAFREMNELHEATKQYEELVEKDKKGEADKDSEEYKQAMEAFQKAGKSAENVRELMLAKLRAVIKGKNVEKLFQDFTYEQIQEIYDRATK